MIKYEEGETIRRNFQKNRYGISIFPIFCFYQLYFSVFILGPNETKWTMDGSNKIIDLK